MRNYLYVRGTVAGLVQLIIVIKRQLKTQAKLGPTEETAAELEPDAIQSDATAPTQVHVRATAVQGGTQPSARWRFGLQVLAQVGVIVASCFFSFFLAPYMVENKARLCPYSAGFRGSEFGLLRAAL